MHARVLLITRPCAYRNRSRAELCSNANTIRGDKGFRGAVSLLRPHIAVSRCSGKFKSYRELDERR